MDSNNSETKDKKDKDNDTNINNTTNTSRTRAPIPEGDFKVPDRTHIPENMTFAEITDLVPYLTQYEFNPVNFKNLIDAFYTVFFNYGQLNSKFNALEEDYKKLSDKHTEAHEYIKTLEGELDKKAQNKEFNLLKEYAETLRKRLLTKAGIDFEEAFQRMKRADSEIEMLRQEFTYRKEDPNNKQNNQNVNPNNNQPKH